MKRVYRWLIGMALVTAGGIGTVAATSATTPAMSVAPPFSSVSEAAPMCVEPGAGGAAAALSGVASTQDGYCGDGICDGEDCGTCIEDCPCFGGSSCFEHWCQTAGDGVCGEGENCQTSPSDCACNSGQVCTAQGGCAGCECDAGVCGWYSTPCGQIWCGGCGVGFKCLNNTCEQCQIATCTAPSDCYTVCNNSGNVQCFGGKCFVDTGFCYVGLDCTQ